MAKIVNKIFNLQSSFKTLEQDDDSITIRGLASTNATDRASDVIDHNAWAKGGLDNYKNNPVILFNHDYNQPIGRAIDIRVTTQGLELTAKISKSAGKVYELIKEGILVAFSVGFMIRDADYIRDTDGFLIKDAELYEVSVVTVPCNQTAIFSVSKSFEQPEEYENYKSVYLAGYSPAEKEVNASKAASDTLGGTKKVPMEKINMDPEELKALLEKAAADAVNKSNADREAREKAATEAAEKAAAEKAAADAKAKDANTATATVVKEAGEKLYEDIAARLAEKGADVGKVIESAMSDLKEQQEALTKMRDSKREFGDRTGTGNWKTDKRLSADVEDAVILSLAMRKGLTETKYGGEVITKVNAHSGVEVSSADFEQTVSTNIERDIENELILIPMFREIQMRSATQIIPIFPDAGYAEITTAQTAAGSSPHGNIATRGDTFGAPYGGNDLTEITLSTIKMMSQSYLGDETEEDAIIPILPLIRESIVRSHARGIENLILAGNHADGVYTSGAAPGLIYYASTQSRNTQSTTAFASDALTGAQLLAARKNMGKYGIRPADVVYIVSQRGYFELLEDAEFQDWNIVGGLATKLTGEVGMIYGSKVMLCDEFATPAVSKYHALAVNVRNFLVPRLRGFRLQSDYETANQRTVIVGTQRLGFKELIPNAKAVWGLNYKAS